MSIEILSPYDLRLVINTFYYNKCIKYDTPSNINQVLKEIDDIRVAYEELEEFRLCQVCAELKTELQLEHDTRVSNNKVDELIKLFTNLN